MKQQLTPFKNRELSWLQFNERVLEEAVDPKVPLCERLSFASIFQTNLDEFFQVRVGSLRDQMLLDPTVRDNKTNMTSEEQIDAVLLESARLNRIKDQAYAEMMADLKPHGVHVVDFNLLDKEESDYLEARFDAEIAPLLSPILLSKRAPFPFLRNKEIYAAVLMESTEKPSKEKKSKKGKKRDRIGIIPCTSTAFPRLMKSPTRQGTYVLSEELILHFVSKVFPDYTIKSKTLFRITRSADIDMEAVYDEDLDYRDRMVELIKRRKKLRPVRMEISRHTASAIIDTMCKELKLKEKNVFYTSTPLDLSFLFQIQDDLRKEPNLFFQRRVPQNSAMFDLSRSILDQVSEGDKMLSFPFENTRPFLHMLQEAANDPSVLSMKMTLYRVARDSKVVEALVEAAENGKEVVVVVELRARFDEENNIEWSRRLENAGCQVIYGLEGYKVHSKLCLITRKKDDQIEYITQIGTGNYNEKTAKLYTDLMVLTANQEIGQEVASIFKTFPMGETVQEIDHLLVAPNCLQNKVLAMMDEEIAIAQSGQPAYIGAKINSLTDKAIVNKLVEASQAGVKIDLVVRGICCLIPGVEGYTENVNVISIVGRYLEHSRIYIFGTEERHKLYIASADYMTRNTLRRVEVGIPVWDEAIQARIYQMFLTMLHDNQKARRQLSDGTYLHVLNEEKPLNSQEYFFQQAYDNAPVKTNV